MLFCENFYYFYYSWIELIRESFLWNNLFWKRKRQEREARNTLFGEILVRI